MKAANTTFGKVTMSCLKAGANGVYCMNGCIYREKTHSHLACGLRNDPFKCLAPCNVSCMCFPHYERIVKNELFPTHTPLYQLQ